MVFVEGYDFIEVDLFVEGVLEGRGDVVGVVVFMVMVVVMVVVIGMFIVVVGYGRL